MLRQVVVDYVVPALGALLAPLLALLVLKFKTWVDQKVRSDKANTLLKRIADAAADVVRDVSAVEVKALLERVGDGKLTSHERGEMRQIAIARLKTYMGPQALTELAAAMKVGTDAVEAIVSSKVEKAVSDMKLAQTAAANATPVAPVAGA